MIYSDHFLDYCELCKTEMIRCKTCDNIGCNGGSGTVDGKPCPDCDDAYAMQAIYWNDWSAITFKVKK